MERMPGKAPGAVSLEELPPSRTEEAGVLNGLQPALKEQVLSHSASRRQCLHRVTSLGKEHGKRGRSWHLEVHQAP